MAKKSASGDASLDVLLKMSSTLDAIKLSLDQTNQRLDSVMMSLNGTNQRLDVIGEHHKDLAADIATLLGDTNVQKVLHPATVGKLRERQFARDHPASERLLATTELLELILLKLSMRDLLLAQRVSRRFQQVTEASLSIRRALFFEPNAVVRGTDEGRPEVNPLFWRSTWSELSELSCGAVVFNDEADAFAVGFRGLTEVSTKGEEGGEAWHACLAISPVVEADRDDDAPKRYYLYGSWRRMYLTQPPCPVQVSPFMAATERVKPQRLGELWKSDCYGGKGGKRRRMWVEGYQNGHYSPPAPPPLA
ncbi:hypothetical protein LTR36_001654 [Oleoguttula mirabilis]|uniref:F-box domain-containing protein n=1 Tax=Oleoguttula mirabilis TaxID=1507867 RepID=A0AAV9JNH7_9PEZI|nr:hypothetical protein LTR36_001654 [Oleoguttula mirabilis]